MAKFINKMKDLMFGEYEDDEDYYEDDYEYEAPAREAAPVSSSYGLRDVSRESDQDQKTCCGKSGKSRIPCCTENHGLPEWYLLLSGRFYSACSK